VTANLLILLTICVSPVQLYTQSNQNYETGNFLQAIEGYEEVTKSVVNADVYYNLGNSYFKEKKIGKAIVNYRRAKFLEPRDSDIRYNLEFARSYRVDKVGGVPGPIARLLSSAFHYFSPYEASTLTAVFFLLSSVLVSVFIVYRKSLLLYGLMVSAPLSFFFFVTWQVWASEMRGRPAVVTVPEASALSGPGEDYKEILAIHDGTEFKIREVRGGYLLIQIPGGIGGWIRKEESEEVFWPNH
jgi:tetratricopeptide (TPR) repeat protein